MDQNEIMARMAACRAQLEQCTIRIHEYERNIEIAEEAEVRIRRKKVQFETENAAKKLRLNGLSAAGIYTRFAAGIERNLMEAYTGRTYQKARQGFEDALDAVRRNLQEQDEGRHRELMRHRDLLCEIDRLQMELQQLQMYEG